MALTDAQVERYARHILLPEIGGAGQAKIQAAKVLVVGAGGLGMSAALAGLTPLAVVERDRWACETISGNKELDFPLVSQWPVTDADVRDFAFES